MLFFEKKCQNKKFQKFFSEKRIFVLFVVYCNRMIYTRDVGMSKTDETRRGGKKKEKRASGNGRKQAHKDRHSKKPCQTRSIEEDQAVRRRDLGERQE